MTKKFVAIMVAVILGAGAIVGAWYLGKGAGANELASHIYPRTAVVVAVDYTNDVVTVMDGVGHEWQFTECEDWHVGDIVSLIMNSNGTENITDDIIMDSLYGGDVHAFILGESDG